MFCLSSRGFSFDILFCDSAGLVNGAGSVGTVIEGPIIGLVAHQWGWMGVLLLMVLLSSLGGLALLRAALSESSLSQTSSNEEEEEDPTRSWPV